MNRNVLITGCSSGIGHATALELQRQGWTVWATARRIETLEDLRAAGCRTLPLDVTDEASMAAAVAAVEAEGGVDALVNNAGYSQSGAIETIPIAAVRKQFETNVFGLVRLTQLVLPAMRARRRGRIINLGSMGGQLTFPGGGIYHATKYALEAISDALRFEVHGFGIDVVLIQPGLIRSGFSDAVMEHMNIASGPYEQFEKEVARSTNEVYVKGWLSKLGGEPADVARAIRHALETARPKPRYRVTASARLFMNLRRLLGDRGWDRMLRGSYPQPGAGR